ncbi:MAG TPA: exodeoxyribonuclease V subunit alpha [Polyangiaceae bacterium LLY-WYZ-15_(1-7)]|nr:exodeoxyribonuclease V subunit alpha [Sandaracinus sp.]HJL05341.1 exodeoxyribonuclease V subunit alpha [Polyangiaceae bacterium LLY-WYZ-15_(1-7)]HJL07959.1 exodeoxyribonuclease V subunit alpha [Polyangiaceae bacterium LLY-WYZ-15_(1-7)]
MTGPGEGLWIDPGGTARAAWVRGGAAGERGALVLDEARVAMALDVDLDEAELFLGAELARWLPVTLREAQLEGHGIEALFAGLVAAARLAHARGSTRLPLAGPGLEAHLADLGLPGAVATLAARVAAEPDAFAPVVGGPEAWRPLRVEGGFLHHQRMHALERRVASRVVERLAPVGQDEDALRRALADVLASPPTVGGQRLRLSEPQQEAVAAACRGRLTLVSGEPGTGKTSIVVSMLRVLARLGVPLGRIALAAPTGKAADRMRRSIEGSLRRLQTPSFDDLQLMKEGPASRTLHRLLGYSPGARRFRHHDRNPLGEDVVIVDESSMVDVAMIDRLLRAVRPDARLVLLGDAEQLPSVDAGAVFRDLCGVLADTPRVSRLTDSYRMDPKDPAGRHVLLVARAIQRGAPEEVSADVRPREGFGELAHAGVEMLTPGEDLGPFLRAWEAATALPEEALGRVWRLRGGRFASEDGEALGALFDAVERARILCLTRGRRTGVHAINGRFHGWLLERAGLPAAVRFAVGEPVLVTRNDYERQLFNGDQGIVLRVRGDEGRPRRAAVFRRGEGFAAFPVDTLRARLELAYAVTIHKAQGSEHERVAVVLPDEPIPLLTREMLYTGVTRARRSVVIVGRPAMLEEGVRRRVERSSGLADFLEAAP